MNNRLTFILGLVTLVLGCSPDGMEFRSAGGGKRTPRTFERPVIQRKDLEAKPYLGWNGFVDVAALYEYEELPEACRPGHLVFWYAAEVREGGHLQFFFNHGTDRVQETIDALESMGAPEYGVLLKKAWDLYESDSREDPSSVDEYVNRAREGGFDEIDREYWEMKPHIDDLLEKHVEENLELYVKVEESPGGTGE